ncbi:MAG: hypothetical protein KAR06_04295 [Deltaproteobacteria bacterium]|nr:hypothetical protein [Deltaproteobacteria bacterium]
MKHTPPPWKVSEQDADRVVDESGYVIAECCGYKGNHNGKGDREANARLIASAPTMHEILKRIDKECGRLMETDDIGGVELFDALEIFQRDIYEATKELQTD